MTTEVSFLRHSGWFSPEYCPDVLNIIGVGATGSYIALCAAKMGFHRFRIWDADKVEAHNLPNQVYDAEHVGQAKVDALSRVLRRFNPAVSVETHEYFFEPQHKDLLDGPLVLTVDTMKGRKEIAECFTGNPMVRGVFETRLGFDHAEVNIFDNLDLEKCKQFKNSLVDDADIPDGPCNLRICTTLVELTAAYTVHNLCAMYVAEKTDQPWVRENKTLIDLTPKLQVFGF